MSQVRDTAMAAWRSPSNIALVKYWGKRGVQLPANPSISFTLDQAVSETTIKAVRRNENGGISLKFNFDGKHNPEFESRIAKFLETASAEFAWLKSFNLEIDSVNTFPHSSGIASSASAYSAMSLCLCTLDAEINGNESDDFYRRASYWSRMGSGSACRSVYGGYNLWGKTDFVQGSSDEYAVNIDHLVDPVFRTFKDTILIIEAGRKSVSSTAGHALLNEHPFAAARYKTANENTGRLLDILKGGDLKDFTAIVEAEALMLHALMMSSPQPFILMKPDTLSVIEKIIDFRNQSGTNLLFTLDAGANVHLLNPEQENKQVQEFVKNELIGFCQNQSYFCNAVGKGPEKL